LQSHSVGRASGHGHSHEGPQGRSTAFSSMLVSGCLGFLVYYYTLTGHETPCKLTRDRKTRIDQPVAVYEAAWWCVWVWLISQVLVRCVLERKHASHWNADPWRGLFVLENAAWVLFILGNMVVRVSLIWVAELELNRWLLMFEFLYHFQVMSAFTLVGPCVAFQIGPVANVQSQVVFLIAWLVFLMRSGYDVLMDANCNLREAYLFSEKLGEANTVYLASLRHFYHTHKFCLLLCVMNKQREHGDHDHAEPDIFMISECFLPLREKWRNLLCCVAGLLVAVFAPLLACEADRSFFPRHMLRDVGNTIGPVSATFAFSTDFLFICFAVVAYSVSKKHRRRNSFQSTCIRACTIVAMTVYCELLQDVSSGYDKVALAIDLVSFLCAGLLAMDVVSGRMDLPFWPITSGMVLMYTFSFLLQALYTEGRHHLAHMSHGAEHPSRRLTGGSREDGTNDLTELLKSIGEYAAVETWLMQAIVWANYYLEKGGEEDSEPHGAHQPPVIPRCKSRLLLWRRVKHDWRSHRLSFRARVSTHLEVIRGCGLNTMRRASVVHRHFSDAKAKDDAAHERRVSMADALVQWFDATKSGRLDKRAFRRVALWCGLSHTDAEWESVFTQLCAANGWPPDLGPDSIQLRGFLMVDMGTSSLHALRQRIQEDLREQVPEVILGA